MTELQIAELRKLMREAPKELHSFREAGADVMLTWKAREVLPKLLDERDELLEALNIFVVLALLPSVTKGDMDAARQNAEAAIAKAEAP